MLLFLIRVVCQCLVMNYRQFLMGLLKYGKGDWRNISRNFVISKSPTQVASHAQKYFIRQLSGGKDKRRPSIHDITIVNLTETTSENNKPPSHDQSFVFPPQQKPTSAPRMSPDWNQPRDEVIIFDSARGNLLMSPPYEFKGQGHDLYGSAHYGFDTKPYIQTQPSIHHIRRWSGSCFCCTHGFKMPSLTILSLIHYCLCFCHSFLCDYINEGLNYIVFERYRTIKSCSGSISLWNQMKGASVSVCFPSLQEVIFLAIHSWGWFWLGMRYTWKWMVASLWMKKT